MKHRLRSAILFIICILALFSCSNDSEGGVFDNAELPSITEVYDQYSGFSTDFISTNGHHSPGLIDFSTEKRYFPIDEVKLKLYFGFSRSEHSIPSHREYAIRVFNRETEAEGIIYRDGSKYEDSEFLFSEDDKKKAVYNHSENIIIPKEVFEAETGRLDIEIYAGPSDNCYDKYLAPNMSLEATSRYCIYYRTDGKTVELSRSENDYGIWIEPLAEWEYIYSADNSDLLDAFRDKYEFKEKKSYLFNTPVRCYDVGSVTDNMKQVYHEVAIGTKTAFGSRILLASFEDCEKHIGDAGGRFYKNLSFNYKGDFSIKMDEGYLKLYLWDDGVVATINFGTYGATLGVDFEIIHVARILNVEENLEAKERMESEAFADKSFERWDYSAELVDPRHVIITVSNKHGETATVFDSKPELQFVKRVIGYFFGNDAIDCHKDHIYIHLY